MSISSSSRAARTMVGQLHFIRPHQRTLGSKNQNPNKHAFPTSTSAKPGPERSQPTRKAHRKTKAELPTPDVKDRSSLPAVPYIASLESDRGRPSLSFLLDKGEDRVVTISAKRGARARAVSLFFRGLVPGRGARAALQPASRPPQSLGARPLAR